MKVYKVEVPICGPVMGLTETVRVQADSREEAIRKAIRAVNRGGQHPVHRAEDKCGVTEDVRESVRRFHLCEKEG